MTILSKLSLRAVGLAAAAALTAPFAVAYAQMSTVSVPEIVRPPAPVLQLQNGVEALLDIPYLVRSGYRPLTLDIYRPKAATGLRPAVVYTHGGGFQAGSNRMANGLMGSADGLMALLASHGYVVFGPEYRLAAEARYPAQLQDVKAAIRWVRANAAKYNVDPDRIAVFGDSVGGSLASLIGTTCGYAEFDEPTLKGANSDQSSCVKAAVSWFGVSDMSQLDTMAASTPEISPYLVHFSADSTQSQTLGCVLHYTCPSEVVQRANPIHYIDDRTKKVSFLIVHGTSDSAVSWKQSQLLYDELRKRDVPAKLVLVPGVGHYFDKGTVEQGRDILNTTIGFLDSTVGAPSKP